ncbi:MAG: YARHG domain-containing protein, partial [bacterium]
MSQLINDRFRTFSALFVFLVTTAVLPNYLLANSSILSGSGGSLVPLKETNLSLQRENLQVSIGDRAKINVTFIVNNPGGPESTTLGFVAKKGSEGGEYFQPKISQFQTTVNGEQVPHKTTDLKNSKFNELGLDFYYPLAVYYSKVDLKPGTNTITHQYKLSAGSKYLVTSHEYYEYILTTAKLWKGGSVGEFNLTIDVSEPGKTVSVPASLSKNNSGEWSGPTRCENNESDKKTFYLKDGNLRYHAKNFTPSQELKIDVFRNPLNPHSTFPLNYGPFYQDSPAELRSKFSQQQLRILRNSFFALEGYKFNSNDLNQYFNNQCWYEPDPDAKATKIMNNFKQGRKQRINTIKAAEESYDQNAVTWQDWLITYDESTFSARDGDTVITPGYYYPQAPMKECTTKNHEQELLSIVGPYISFRFTHQQQCGGASAFVKRNWITLDLRKGGTPVTVTDVFSPQRVKKQLETRHIVREAMRNNGVYNCVNVKKSIKSGASFAFVQNYKGKAHV